MGRVQAIEFEDFGWFPSVIRDSMTDYFNFQMSLFDLYRPAVPLLAEALERTGHDRLVDLCAGGGGPHGRLGAGLATTLGRPVRTTLTDKFPNLAAFERMRREGTGVDFEARSVDAMDVPEDLRGFRTVFSAFHHFPPVRAAAILQDAVDKAAPIAVFELSHRGPSAFLQVLLGGPIGLLLGTPAIRPPRLSRYLLTYVIPAIPFFAIWDGVASNLRAYSPSELRDLVAALSRGDSFEWEIGQEAGPVGVRVTYLIGTPRGGRAPAPAA